MAVASKKRASKLTKGDFKIYIGDVSYFYKVIGIHNEYQISLEPCDKGFEVALYRRDKDYRLQQVGEKRCTAEYGYQDDLLHEKERNQITWERALIIVNEMIDERLPVGIER